MPAGSDFTSVLKGQISNDISVEKLGNMNMNVIGSLIIEYPMFNDSIVSQPIPLRSWLRILYAGRIINSILLWPAQDEGLKNNLLYGFHRLWPRLRLSWSFWFQGFVVWIRAVIGYWISISTHSPKAHFGWKVDGPRKNNKIIKSKKMRRDWSTSNSSRETIERNKNYLGRFHRQIWVANPRMSKKKSGILPIQRNRLSQSTQKRRDRPNLSFQMPLFESTKGRSPLTLFPLPQRAVPLPQSTDSLCLIDLRVPIHPTHIRESFWTTVTHRNWVGVSQLMTWRRVGVELRYFQGGSTLWLSFWDELMVVRAKVRILDRSTTGPPHILISSPSAFGISPCALWSLKLKLGDSHEGLPYISPQRHLSLIMPRWIGLSGRRRYVKYQMTQEGRQCEKNPQNEGLILKRPCGITEIK